MNDGNNSNDPIFSQTLFIDRETLTHTVKHKVQRATGNGERGTGRWVWLEHDTE
jgi:hypothetical protein